MHLCCSPSWTSQVNTRKRSRFCYQTGLCRIIHRSVATPSDSPSAQPCAVQERPYDFRYFTNHKLNTYCQWWPAALRKTFCTFQLQPGNVMKHSKLVAKGVMPEVIYHKRLTYRFHACSYCMKKSSVRWQRTSDRIDLLYSQLHICRHNRLGCHPLAHTAHGYNPWGIHRCQMAGSYWLAVGLQLGR